MKPATRKASAVERSQATHALLSAILELGEAGTDHAHQRFELPPCVDQRFWGSVTAGLIAAGIIERIGDRHTSRGIAHGRRIGMYRITDRRRAIALRDQLAGSAARQRDRQPALPGLEALNV